MTYSLDFRTKVFRIKEKKRLTFEQISDHFDISIRTLFRWQKKLEPAMTRNKPATKINMDRLEKDIERHPDDYQWEPGKRLGVTQSAIHYALQRLGVSYKKTLQHPKTNQQAGNPIVYLDESGFAQDAWLFEKGNTLLRDSGLPCWGWVNVMGALMGMTFLTVALFDGRVNSDVFYAWLIQEL